MRELWHKTWKLSRDYPVLWLPCICAEIISIVIWQLRGLAEHAIFHHFLPMRSALGGSIGTYLNRVALAKASVTYSPIGFASILAVVFVFVLAFMLTAQATENLNQAQDLQWGELATQTLSRWSQAAIFTLKLLAVSVLLGLCAALLAIKFGSHRSVNEGVDRTPILITGSVILIALVVWLLLPAATKLIRAESVILPPKARAIISISAAATALIGFLLSNLAARMERGFLYTQTWQVGAISVLNSLLAEAPEALLFIAIALAAHAEQSQAQLVAEPDPLL